MKNFLTLCYICMHQKCSQALYESLVNAFMGNGKNTLVELKLVTRPPQHTQNTHTHTKQTQQGAGLGGSIMKMAIDCLLTSSFILYRAF